MNAPTPTLGPRRLVFCSARWVTATRIRRKKPPDYRGVGHSNFLTVRASKALGVIGRTDDRHLTQRRERPSPRHASARRKLSLKVGQSLLKAGYLRLDQYKP